jgi:hypothetical protein
VNDSARLFVEDADSKPRLWATVDLFRVRSESVTIVVKDVRHGSKGIEVSFDKQNGSTSQPAKKSVAQATDAWPHFLLAGLGCCGLVLLAPRARRKSVP